MIPVIIEKDIIKLLEYSNQDRKYIDLLTNENKYINSNKNEILRRAYKMYDLVVNKNNEFFKKISCDFKLLEEKCLNYKTK